MTAPGPLGEEARLLIEAAREWAARTFPEAEEHLATCQWCPLCRGVAALRSPDVADKVAAAVTTAAAALAAILDAVSTPPPAPAGPPAPAEAAVPGPPAFVPVPERHDIPVD